MFDSLDFLFLFINEGDGHDPHLIPSNFIIPYLLNCRLLDSIIGIINFVNQKQTFTLNSPPTNSYKFFSQMGG